MLRTESPNIQMFTIGVQNRDLGPSTAVPGTDFWRATLIEHNCAYIYALNFPAHNFLSTRHFPACATSRALIFTHAFLRAQLFRVQLFHRNFPSCATLLVRNLVLRATVFDILFRYGRAHGAPNQFILILERWKILIQF